MSYPLLLLSHNRFNPYALLGPLANWFFLRQVGGDKENEATQEKRYQANDPEKMQDLAESREEKNAFWPGISETVNPWFWGIVATGFGGALLERIVSRWSSL
jgi:hypothetical protein